VEIYRGFHGYFFLMKAHKITVPRTAHYYTLGEISDATKYFWFVTHGYGQLASRIIQKFNELDLSEHFIVAPEGLSSFYWEGVNRYPVSSWMTRKDRLDEIADYANYLSLVYDKFRLQLPNNVQVNLFGFSQGVATQYRWIMQKFPHFHHLVMWAGHLPEDLDYTPYLDYFSDKTITFLYGNQDHFLTEERLEWHNQIISEKGLEIKQMSFEGKHVVDRTVLKKLNDDLSRK